MSEPLKFGETPWDNLSREELLRHVQRMWSTIVSLESVVLQMKALDAGVYWSKRGVGGSTLEKARQVRASIDCPAGSERDSELYRSFFRYATDLLFDRTTGYRLMGFGWMVCAKDGNMWGAGGPDEVPPQTCHECGGPLRPLEWKDLEPSKEQPT